jgi:hypothetical protein
MNLAPKIIPTVEKVNVGLFAGIPVNFPDELRLEGW